MATAPPPAKYPAARQLGRVDNKTWAKWKDAARKAGQTFTEFAREAIEKAIAEQAA